MSSRLRSATKSNVKEKKLQVSKIYYPPPNDKQFIAFSPVIKQSNSGIRAHQRFLVFDSFSKSLRYYSKIPTPLPQSIDDLADGKQIIFIKKVRNFQFCSAKSNIGRAIVSWSDENGQRKNWQLTFSSNQLMKDWVIVVNQAKNDGHLHPGDRPIIRRQTKINTQKYETEFIKQTGGIISRQSSSLNKSKISNLQSLESSVNKSDWLTKITNQRQKQINQKHKQFYQEQNKRLNTQAIKQANRVQNKKQQKKNQSPPLFNKPVLINDNQNIGNSKLQRISVIPQEDESKMSKKQANQLRTDSTKNFRIDRQPIPETIQQNSQITIKKSDGLPNQKPKNDKNAKEDLAQKLIEKSLIFEKQKKKSIQIAKMKEAIQHLSFQQKQIKENKFQISRDREQNYIDQLKYFPLLYWRFVKKSQQIAVLIIQKLPSLIKAAKQQPNSLVFIDQQGFLVINKQGIQFKYQTRINNKNGQIQWSCSTLKIHHYSSMVQYIARLTHSQKIPLNYSKILPIPSCIVNYKWQQIICKVILPKNFLLLNPNQQQMLNTFFQMPTGSWQYYHRNQIIVVDYAVDRILINSQPDQETVFEICEDICKQQTQIGHVKDLLLYCQSKFSIHLDTQLIIRLMQKIKEQSNRHIFTRLLSILFGIRSAKFILKQLVDKIYLLQNSQIYESIDEYIKAFTVDNKCLLSSRIMSLITYQLQSKNITILNTVPDIHTVFSTIVNVLGLQLYKNGNTTNKRHSIRFVPILHTLSSSGLSQQMMQIDTLIKNTQKSTASQIQKYQEYQHIKNLLNLHESLWKQSEQINKPRSNSIYSNQQQNISTYYTNPRSYKDVRDNRSKKISVAKQNSKGKYLNNYYRIMHYRSLYEPYQLNSAQINDAYSVQLQSIINEEPPTYYSYMIGINCIKWVSKKGIGCHYYVTQMLNDQIQNCKQWAGRYSPFLLSYYQLYAIYAQQIFDLHSAVENARYALQTVIQIYGDSSAQLAEKWFLLANILVQGQLYEQALQAYLKSLKVLKMSQANLTMLGNQITSSRTTLLSWRLNTTQAQFTIHIKLMKLYLALGQIKLCLNQCTMLLKNVDQIAEERPFQELQILNTIVRCCQINKEQIKLRDMVRQISLRFGSRLIQLNSNANEQTISFQQNLRQQMMKICLNPYIQARITDLNRKNFLFAITKMIRTKYQHRYTQKQYNSYLTKTAKANYSIQNQKFIGSKNKYTNTVQFQSFNILAWIVDMFQQIPIFASVNKWNESLDLNYSLYENSINSKIQPVTQPKLLICAMRIIESLCGIIGYSYLQSCFQL